MKFNGEGGFVTKRSTAGSGPGQFLGPNDVAMDGDGNVYVMDTDNNRVRVFGPTYLAPDPTFGVAFDGSFEDTSALAHWTYGCTLLVTMYVRSEGIWSVVDNVRLVNAAPLPPSGPNHLYLPMVSYRRCDRLPPGARVSAGSVEPSVIRPPLP